MSRKTQIIQALQTGAQSLSNLALITGAPKPSIRRDIQALRREGFNICFSDQGEQLYRLGPNTGIGPEPGL